MHRCILCCRVFESINACTYHIKQQQMLYLLMKARCICIITLSVGYFVFLFFATDLWLLLNLVTFFGRIVDSSMEQLGECLLQPSPELNVHLCLFEVLCSAANRKLFHESSPVHIYRLEAEA